MQVSFRWKWHERPHANVIKHRLDCDDSKSWDSAEPREVSAYKPSYFCIPGVPWFRCPNIFIQLYQNYSCADPPVWHLQQRGCGSEELWLLQVFWDIAHHSCTTHPWQRKTIGTWKRGQLHKIGLRSSYFVHAANVNDQIGDDDYHNFSHKTTWAWFQCDREWRLSWNASGKRVRNLNNILDSESIAWRILRIHGWFTVETFCW